MGNPKNIVLIGAGNLGSRHLQALKAVDFKLNIIVVDPNEQSLQIAQERYDLIKDSSSIHTIQYSKILEDLYQFEVDLAIIATNSDVRSKVIQKLVEKNKIKNIILEKILFQDPEDYPKIQKLFEDLQINAWVNCPRRTFSIYQRIKEDLKHKPIYFKISGSKWNLVSNLIHYIDTWAYLTGINDFIVDTTNLDAQLITSKRKGFNELNGMIHIKFSDGSYGTLHCIATGNLPGIHEVYTDSKRYIIKEGEGKAWYYNAENGHDWEEIDATFKYQSQLTTEVVNQMFREHSCNLTPYNESKQHHLSIFNPILKHLNHFSQKSDKIYPFS